MLGSAVDLDTPNLIIQEENIENKQNKVGAKMFFFCDIWTDCYDERQNSVSIAKKVKKMFMKCIFPLPLPHLETN